jgi:hypothetical protein
VSALDGYRSSTYDDAVAPDGSIRPAARGVMEAVLAHDLAELAATRVALDEGALVVNSSQNGGAKDTWVLP